MTQKEFLAIHINSNLKVLNIVCDIDDTDRLEYEIRSINIEATMKLTFAVTKFLIALYQNLFDEKTGKFKKGLFKWAFIVREVYKLLESLCR